MTGVIEGVASCSDDETYRAWWASNRDRGYVVNVRHSLVPSYMVLHRASCWTMAPDRYARGALTERSYRKVCSVDVANLKLWAKQHGRTDGSFSKYCQICDP